MANNPNARDNLKPAVKGEVRNPNGRPKGSKNLATLVKELEDEDFDWSLVPVKQKDQAKKIGSPWKAILFTAIAKAMSGDVKAMEWLRKSGYGDKMVHEIQGGFFTAQKIEVEIVRQDSKNTNERNPAIESGTTE